MMSYSETAFFFDGTASLYDEWFLKDTYYMEMIARIISRLLTYNPNTIVELGCGTGNLSVLLGKHFPESQVIGIDISQKLLDTAREKCNGFPNVQFHEHDIMDTVAEISGDFTIVANYSLHHLEDEKKNSLLSKLGEVVQPGNVVLIGDVFFNSAKYDGSELSRSKAILDLILARAHYYLKVVGLERCIFEIEHLPLLLRNEREYLVESGFWSRQAIKHGLSTVSDESIGPPEIGNYVVELTVP